MSRKVWFALGLVVTLGVVLLAVRGLFGSSPGADGEEASAAGAQASASREQAVRPAPRSDPATPASPTGSPTLDQAASAADGALEVSVVALGKPVAGAEVRLYWRGATDPNTQAVDWRRAGEAKTSADGRVRLLAKPGAYLVSARAPGRATARAQVVRPFGERLTRVQLTMEAGSTLSGTTVVKGTREPVPLAELELVQLTALNGGGDDAPVEEHVFTNSDPRGRFQTPPLAPGTYRVEARAPGIGHAVLPRVSVPRGAPLTLELIPASTLEGFVVLPDGTGAPDAEVMAAGEVPAVGTTGPGGGFSLEVQPGRYQLSARRQGLGGAIALPVSAQPGGTVKGLRIVLGDGARLEGEVTARTDGRPIRGAAVAVSPHDLNGDTARAITDDTGHFQLTGLAPAAYDVVVTAAGYGEEVVSGLALGAGQTFPLQVKLEGSGAVEGTVTDSGGAPVAGILIKGGMRWGGSLGAAAAEARTGPDGSYRLEGVTAGRVELVARRDSDSIGAMRVVEITEGKTAHADFILNEGGSISGKVTTAGGGPAASGTVVNLFALGADRQTEPFSRIPVTAEGTYEATLPAGTYRLWPVVEGATRIGRGAPETTRVTLHPGDRIEKDLVLPATPERLLRGEVVEADGTPSAQAFASLLVAGELQRVTSTDEDGRFAFELTDELSADELTIGARNGGRTGETAVNAGGSEVTVRLGSASTLHGRVRSPEPGTVAGFTVTTSGDGPLAYSGFGGGALKFVGDTFDLVDLPPGALRVQVETDDGRMGTGSVTLAAGAAGQIEITLQPGAAVSGRIIDGTHAPVSGAFLSVDGVMSFSHEPTRTGADGRFQIQNLAPGAHLLQAFAPHHGVLVHNFEVTAGASLELGDLLLPARPGPTVEAPAP